jgi:large subunit ribosomal protein L27Ae
MRQFHLKKNLHYRPVVNLDKLWNLVPQSVQEEAKNKKDQSLLIDVTKFGFFKVLGKGVLPKVPLVVKAKFFSKKAERKIKEVGGACVLCA